MKALLDIKNALELNIAIQQDFTNKHTPLTLTREEYEILLVGYCAMKEALAKLDVLMESMEFMKLMEQAEH